MTREIRNWRVLVASPCRFSSSPVYVEPALIILLGQVVTWLLVANAVCNWLEIFLKDFLMLIQSNQLWALYRREVVSCTGTDLLQPPSQTHAQTHAQTPSQTHAQTHALTLAQTDFRPCNPSPPIVVLINKPCDLQSVLSAINQLNRVLQS